MEIEHYCLCGHTRDEHRFDGSCETCDCYCYESEHEIPDPRVSELTVAAALESVIDDE